MSEGPRTVIAMAEQMQLNRPDAVLETSQAAQKNLAHEDPCPRCDSAAVRVIVYGPLDFEVEATDSGDTFDALAESPIFDCRDCGFAWGLSVRDLLA
jgi:hypothetical protein